jgi:hypothetical protein
MNVNLFSETMDDAPMHEIKMVFDIINDDIRNIYNKVTFTTRSATYHDPYLGRNLTIKTSATMDEGTFRLLYANSRGKLYTWLERVSGFISYIKIYKYVQRIPLSQRRIGGIIIAEIPEYISEGSMKILFRSYDNIFIRFR